MASFKFGYDLRYSDHVKTEFEVTVECEITFKSKEEYEVEHIIFKQEDDSEVSFEGLEIRDRALISDQAWNPPQSAIDEAYSEYLEALGPQYKGCDWNFI